MPLLQRLKHYLFPGQQPVKEPQEAYDHWSAHYDDQPDNLMLDLDEHLVVEFLQDLPPGLPVIADVGCGTGRHWKKLFAFNPEKILGFDISAGMLYQLNEKYPDAETFLLTGTELPSLDNESCDLVLSTLTIAHIQNIEHALREWSRVLKPGGSMIITDYHPAALSKGAKRTYSHNAESVAIRNYIHSIGKIRECARQLGLEIGRFTERTIDASVKAFYEKQGALAIYENFYGMQIIYGIQLKKPDAHSAGQHAW